jgi:site-specific recombinase XerD
MPENTDLLLVPLPKEDLALSASDLEKLSQLFLAALAKRVEARELSTATLDAYRRGIGKFIAWKSRKDSRPAKPGDSGQDEFTLWKIDLFEQKLQPATINVWLAGVKALFAWAFAAHYLPYNPAANVRTAKRTHSREHKRENLTAEEVRRLLAMPDSTTAQGKRDLAILSLMLRTGLRGISVHLADVQDLYNKQGQLRLRYQGKGRFEKAESVTITDGIVVKARTALYEWLSVREGPRRGPLFVSLSNRSRNGRLSLRSLHELVMGYIDQAGIPGRKTTHSLRHTAITRAVHDGVPLQRVMNFAGHADPATTMIYFHEEQDARDPVESHIDYSD